MRVRCSDLHFALPARLEAECGAEMITEEHLLRRI
jgi:hypothetical protein